MINGTIKENLLYGDINATVDEVNQICEKIDASITNVPNIYILDNGHIVDRGDNDSLLTRCPIYSVLINNQS